MTNDHGGFPTGDVVEFGGRRALSVAEVATMYGLHRATVYRDIEAGRLMAFGFGEKGGAIRVPITALPGYEAAATIKPKAA